MISLEDTHVTTTGIIFSKLDEDKRTVNEFKNIMHDLDKLSFKDIFLEILSFYSCPESCEASCCKEFDINYDKDDIERISNVNHDYKKILCNLVKIKASVKGVEFEEFRNPVKPCQFLNKSKCTIQKIKPFCCKFYPFNVDKNGYVGIDRCYLGTDICIDFMIYLVSLSRLDKNFMYQAQTMQDAIISEIIQDKTKVKELKVTTFSDPNVLKGFLLFLKSMDASRLKHIREGYKSVALNEKIKQLMKDD